MPFLDRRWPAGVAVLLIHLGFLALLLQTAHVSAPRMPPALSVFHLLREAPTPAPESVEPRPTAPRPQFAPIAAPVALPQVPVPEIPGLQTPAPGISVLPMNPGESAPAASGPSSPPTPLNLSLPRNGGRLDAAPVPAQLAAQDGRANSPREGAVERMANALGAKGWTVIDLGDGARMVRGPFGECQIIRPSMVDGIAGHPHAGMLPARAFSCGGIAKGSLKHERPK